MSATKIFSVFAVLVMLYSLLMSEAGTIHSSLGTGDTKNGWKPGGKRDFGGLDCQDLSSETLNFLFHTVNEASQKLSICLKIKYGFRPEDEFITPLF